MLSETDSTYSTVFTAEIRRTSAWNSFRRNLQLAMVHVGHISLLKVGVSLFQASRVRGVCAVVPVENLGTIVVNLMDIVSSRLESLNVEN